MSTSNGSSRAIRGAINVFQVDQRTIPLSHYQLTSSITQVRQLCDFRSTMNGDTTNGRMLNGITTNGTIINGIGPNRADPNSSSVSAGVRAVWIRSEGTEAAIIDEIVLSCSGQIAALDWGRGILSDGEHRVVCVREGRLLYRDDLAIIRDAFRRREVEEFNVSVNFRHPSGSLLPVDLSTRPPPSPPQPSESNGSNGGQINGG